MSWTSYIGSWRMTLQYSVVFVLCPTRMFSLIWMRPNYRWSAYNFDLYTLWPLSSTGYLTCHTYCDSGLPYIMVISGDQWYSHLFWSGLQWRYHCKFLQLLSVAAVIRTPNLPHVRHTLLPTVWIQYYSITDINSDAILIYCT